MLSNVEAFCVHCSASKLCGVYVARPSQCPRPLHAVNWTAVQSFQVEGHISRPLVISIDFSTSNWGLGSFVSWPFFLPIFRLLYCFRLGQARDRQMDRQRPSMHYAARYGDGHNILPSILVNHCKCSKAETFSYAFESRSRNTIWFTVSSAMQATSKVTL